MQGGVVVVRGCGMHLPALHNPNPALRPSQPPRPFEQLPPAASLHDSNPLRWPPPHNTVWRHYDVADAIKVLHLSHYVAVAARYRLARSTVLYK